MSDRLAQLLADITGECPGTRYEWQPELGCEVECSVGMDATCLARYGAEYDKGKTDDN